MSNLFLFEMLANIALPLGLLLIGYVFGRIAERRHYARLRKEEAELAHILVFTERHLPDGALPAGGMVHGCVVVGQDYFKAILAGLRGIFGGRIAAYETLIDRARREAIVRLKRDADQGGATMVTNIKYSTTRIGRAIEVVAYGTPCQLHQAP